MSRWLLGIPLTDDAQDSLVLCSRAVGNKHPPTALLYAALLQSKTSVLSRLIPTSLFGRDRSFSLLLPLILSLPENSTKMSAHRAGGGAVSRHPFGQTPARHLAVNVKT
jgi:hypothetical protein